MKIEFNTKENLFRKYNSDGEYKEVKIIKKNLDRLLSLIANRLTTNSIHDGYVDIHSSKLREVVHNSEEYLEWMRIEGLLERDYYVVPSGGKKGKSWGYRFSPLYAENIKIISMTNEPGDVKYDLPTKEQLEPIYHKPIEPLLYENLENDFNDVVIDYNFNNVDKPYDEWGNFIMLDRWFKTHFTLYRWLEGRTHFHYKRGRIYSNFVKLDSTARVNNVSFGNGKLVEYDITSSYPLMLCKAIPNNSNYDYKDFCSKVLSGTIYNSIQKGLNRMRNSNKEGEYIESCEDGVGYKGDLGVRMINRNEVKALFMMWLNGSRDIQFINGLSIDIGIYIKTTYPTVYEFITDYKSDKPNGKIYDLLVSMERDYIMDLVATLYSKYEGIKILTCHDAIYVEEEFDISEDWNLTRKEFIKDLPYEEIKVEVYEKKNVIPDDIFDMFS